MERESRHVWSRHGDEILVFCCRRCARLWWSSWVVCNVQSHALKPSSSSPRRGGLMQRPLDQGAHRLLNPRLPAHRLCPMQDSCGRARRFNPILGAPHLRGKGRKAGAEGALLHRLGAIRGVRRGPSQRRPLCLRKATSGNRISKLPAAMLSADISSPRG